MIVVNPNAQRFITIFDFQQFQQKHSGQGSELLRHKNGTAYLQTNEFRSCRKLFSRGFWCIDIPG